ncbi:hypothetical protein [Dehalobacterium formicoaceticum]|uniref:hypothetical protein n=1 Tax=Dehalobacterium formicoaceticum TaxID=51515 RepID=UPI0031F64E47
MIIAVLILIFSVLALIAGLELFKKRQWQQLITVLMLLAFGFTLSLLLAIGIEVPNPNKGIEFLIKGSGLPKLFD